MRRWVTFLKKMSNTAMKKRSGMMTSKLKSELSEDFISIILSIGSFLKLKTQEIMSISVV